MTYQLGHHINGSCYDDISSMLAIHNPATGKLIGKVAIASPEIVDLAVRSALQAFPAWANTPPQKRLQVLFRFKFLLEQHADKIAFFITQEHGKTLADAAGSIKRGIELVEFICSMPYLLRGSYSENVASAIDCYTYRQPLGVCCGITPFNFPVMVPIWQFAPAIACGNTFVLKPSEQTPSAANKIIELLYEAGLPPGVVNIVNGDKSTVESLCDHQDVAAVTAVASSTVARSIYQKAVFQGKRAVTYGGAKNHCVVMPDVDAEQTAIAIAGAAFGSAGERCMAVSVVVTVGDTVVDPLVDQLKIQIEKMQLGPGTQDETTMGPVISQRHLHRIQDYIATGIEEGASLLVDGRVHPMTQQDGYYIGPTLFDHVKQEMKIYQEEIFGPVLVICRVDSFEAAIELVSRHPYGNGCAIFTRDGETARSFSSQVAVGMVGINVAIPVPIAYHSFGGWKMSLFGDIGMHGDQSVQFYTKLKSVTARWPKGLRTQADYTMPIMNK